MDGQHAVRICELESQGVLQQTKYATIERMRSLSGANYVLKRYAPGSKSLALEAAVLQAIQNQSFRHLVVPRLIVLDNEKNNLLMTYVPREHHDRSSILNRSWSQTELQVLTSALAEFQSLDLPRKLFSRKQFLMGLAYPSVKAILALRPSLKRRLLRPTHAIVLMWWALAYLVIRPFFRNVTTHYDLTTLNCAMTPECRVSILDFEFSYYRGDPLFDIAYFTTIPPEAIHRWRFQRTLLGKFLVRHSSPAKRFRLRLILTVCCLVRALHFDDQSKEQNQYVESLGFLFSSADYRRWYDHLIDDAKQHIDLVPHSETGAASA